MRVKLKFTVKNAVCNGLGHPYTVIVTVNLALTRTSGAALNRLHPQCSGAPRRRLLGPFRDDSNSDRDLLHSDFVDSGVVDVDFSRLLAPRSPPLLTLSPVEDSWISLSLSHILTRSPLLLALSLP